MNADEIRQLGRFSIVASLGQGGMGRVYRAHDPELGRDVAIKVLRPDARDPETSRIRLQREAKAMAKLAHPNVITVHEVGRNEDDVFVVMEHVAGGTLTSWLTAPRTWKAIAAVIAQVADGLIAAHAVGLVHRDVKPDNILIGDDGRARITDFGLVGVEAVPEAERGEEELTHTGMRIGTIGYMAPEQIEGGAATELSDQFGLCATAYEALAGTRPFTGATYREIALATVNGTITAPRREVPEDVLAIVKRGLARDPGARWPELAALAQALRAVADEGEARAVRSAPALSSPVAVAVAAPSQAPSTIARSRSGLAGVAALALAGAGIAFVVTRGTEITPRNVVEPPPEPVRPAVRGAPVFERPGCAREPTFLGEDELAFAYSNGDAGDVYVRDLVRGTERRLTTSPTVIEHHPMASIGDRSLTVIAQEQGGAGFWAQRISVDGAVTRYPSATIFLNAGALWIRDRLYYVIGDGGTLISLHDNTTSEIHKQPAGGYVWAMAASADGRYLAVNVGAMCVLDLQARPGTEPACVTPPDAPFGRYLLDPSATHIYYGAWDGIHAIDRQTTADRLVVAGAGPGGGMDLSPSGKRIAWSDCQPQIALTELGTNRTVHHESLTSPVTNKLGAWVFVRETPATSILAYREPTGLVRELTTAKQLPGAPALDPNGERVVFARGDAPGLWLAYGVRQRALEPITTTAGDTNPVWIGRDQIAFTRPRGDGKPEVWTFDLDRRDPPKRVSDRVRQTIDTQDGEVVLLMNDDRTRLFLWNSRTGDEREVVQPPEFHQAPLLEAELSPDAKSIVVIRGSEVWRFAVAGGPATRVWVPPVGHALFGLEVDAADHVIVGDAQNAGTIYTAELP